MSHPLKNQQRAKTAIILIWVVLATELLLTVSTYFEYNLLTQLSQGVDISDEVIERNDSRQTALVFLNLLAFIISGVTFILWFRRAYANLHAYSDAIGYENSKNYLDFSEGWAAWGWFVPFINLVRPFQIMKELYEEGAEIIKRRRDDFQVEDKYTLMIVWWVLWIGVGIVSNISTRMSLNTEDVRAYITSDAIDIVLGIVMIPLSFVTVKLIKDYTMIEEVLSKLYTEKDETETY